MLVSIPRKALYASSCCLAGYRALFKDLVPFLRSFQRPRPSLVLSRSVCLSLYLSISLCVRTSFSTSVLLSLSVYTTGTRSICIYRNTCIPHDSETHTQKSTETCMVRQRNRDIPFYSFRSQKKNQIPPQKRQQTVPVRDASTGEVRPPPAFSFPFFEKSLFIFSCFFIR